MQFRDLRTQYQKLKNDIDREVEKVMTDANFIMGQQVKDLERNLAEYVGVKHCLTCGNGTDALQLAAMAMEFKEGDAVFVPNFTFFASGEIVSLQGATPVFVDVDRDTFNLCPEKLKEAIEKVKAEGKLNLKAVIAVDLFGLPANYREIVKITHDNGMYLLEDAAQGFGGEIDGKRACSFGDISTTSFFPAKPLGCYGDGGAIFTDNDEWAKLMDSYRVHGKGENKYDNIRIGVNSRLDTIQAAILSVKLKAFADYEVEAVNKVAERYTAGLKDTFETPVIPEGFMSSWAQYTLKLKDRETRDRLQAQLKEQGIPTMIYYPKPMDKQEAFEIGNYLGVEFDITNQLCDTVLSLPMHPYLTEEEIDTVMETLKKAI